jgi:hypothetical protein
MRFQGAVVREQGVSFAVVAVKKHVVDDRRRATEAIGSFQPVFPGLPVVLVAQDARGRPTYHGRQDIARFLARVPLSAIPWREYTLT